MWVLLWLWLQMGVIVNMGWGGRGCDFGCESGCGCGIEWVCG